MPIDTGPFFYTGDNIKQLMRDAVRHDLIPHPEDISSGISEYYFSDVLSSLAGFLIKKRVPMTDILESATVMQYLQLAREHALPEKIVPEKSEQQKESGYVGLLARLNN